MNAQVREAGRALEAALEAVKEFDSPVLTAADRAELDKIARRVAERLAALNLEERRLSLQ
jgi:hypothetical protein